MKSYRTVDEVLSDRRKGTKLSEVVESILNSPYVLERIDTPFEIIQGLHPGDYLDASTEAWRELPVELQIKYSSAYQRWYAQKLGYFEPTTYFYLDNCDTIMQLIPPMRYVMGYDRDSEIVLIKKPVWMGKYEVTQFEWESVMGNNPSFIQAGGLYPVESVSWNDCVEFCKKTKMKLPHEKLWECACRAGTTTRYSFGNYPEKRMNYSWCGGNSEGRTHPVGELESNAWGLHDMTGNVWEWCENKWISNGVHRVIRGSSYINYCTTCAPTTSSHEDPDASGETLGFRICKPL